MPTPPTFVALASAAVSAGACDGRARPRERVGASDRREHAVPWPLRHRVVRFASEEQNETAARRAGRVGPRACNLDADSPMARFGAERDAASCAAELVLSDARALHAALVQAARGEPAVRVGGGAT
eukprot:2356990-Pleurochrysis_carterae.AAC.2